MRKLLTLSTAFIVAGALLTSCGGGGGGSSTATTTTTVSQPSQPESTQTTQTAQNTQETQPQENTQQETRTVPLTGQLEPASRGYLFGQTDISFAVATYIDSNGTAQVYSSPVSDNGTFTIDVPAGLSYVLSFFDANGTPVISTIDQEVEIPTTVQEAVITVLLADDNGDGRPDTVEVVPKQGAQVVKKQLHDQDGDGLPDELENRPDFMQELISHLAQHQVELHLHQQELEEQPEQQQQQEQIEHQGQEQENATQTASPENVENLQQVEQLALRIPLLESVFDLWDRGEVARIDKENYPSASYFVGDTGKEYVTITGNYQYQVRYEDFGFNNYFYHMNGSVLYSVVNDDVDVLRLDSLSYQDAYQKHTIEFGQGFDCEIYAPAYNVNEYPQKQTVVMKTRGACSGTLKIDGKELTVSLSGSAQNGRMFARENINLSGNITYNGTAYQVHTENLTLKYYQDPTDKETLQTSPIITGTIILKSGDNTYKLVYNANNPDTVEDDTVSIYYKDSFVEELRLNY